MNALLQHRGCTLLSAGRSLAEMMRELKEGAGRKEFPLVVKGDVQGSVEAVSEALSKLTGEKARLAIIHAAVGAITEGDVNLAVAARAVIVGFNVKPAGKSSALAEENKIAIRLYTIIYQAVDDVRAAMEGAADAPFVAPPTMAVAWISIAFGPRDWRLACCNPTRQMTKPHSPT